MKKALALILATLMVLSLVACGGGSSTTSSAPAASSSTASSSSTAAPSGEFSVSDSDPNVTIMIAHSSGEETVLNRACLKYKELAEAYSNGKITVDVYPNGTLISVAEMNEAIKDGSVQMIVGSPGGMMSDAIGILELPNLVNSLEQAHDVMQPGTEFRTILNGVFEDVGVRLQGIEPCDFRMLTANRAVNSYEDLAGLRIRLMDSPVPMAYWKQWGANPGPLAWSEVYMALQQNMFEAQENPYDSIIAANLQEVQKYLIQTNHVMFYTALMMNKAFYDSQPDNYKAILDKVAEEVCAYSYQDAKDSSAANLKKLQDAGMTYIALTDDDYAKMRANASDADNIVKAAIGDEQFNKMMSALGF